MSKRSQRGDAGRGSSWSAARRGASARQLAALAMQLDDSIAALQSRRWGAAGRDLTEDELERLEGLYAELDEIEGYLAS